jgi:hypothetical protein
MNTGRLMICSTAWLTAAVPSGYAGPCTTNIGNMWERINAALEAKAAAGSWARESGFAGMGHQPTPRSLAAAEAKLGELSPRAVAAVQAAMTQANAADAAGDVKACEKALKSVRRILRH